MFVHIIIGILVASSAFFLFSNQPSKEDSAIKKVFRALLWVAVFVGSVALIEDMPPFVAFFYGLVVGGGSVFIKTSKEIR